MLMKNNLIFYCFLLVLCNSGCRSSKKDITIVFVNRDTSSGRSHINGEKLFYVVDNYVIRNYRENTETLEKIESFTVQMKDKNFVYYTQYNMCFFKETEEENLSIITANKNTINKYLLPDNIVVDYVWSSGKFLNKYKMKDGGVINPAGEKPIIIENIK
jgi:hypothetical protein